MQRYLFAFQLLLSLLFMGCHHKKKSASMPPMKIEVAEVVSDSVAMSYEFVTHLESGNVTSLQPRVNGYLQRSTLHSGRVVKKGELLFVIDANLLNTTLRSAEAQLLSAQAQEAEARSNYERAKPLAELNAISQTQIEQYRTTYLAAQQSVESARQQLQNARLQVGYARIYAPIDGVAAASSANEGDYVGVGTPFSTLTTISNMDSLKAELSLPTAIYLSVAGDERAMWDNRDLLSNIRLYLTSGEEYEYAGAYDYTQQNISPTAGTITLVVQFPNPEYRLKAGEYARIRCDLGGRKRQVLVPQQAVQSIQGVRSVWVIDSDSVAHYRPIEVGATLGKDYIVEKGLYEGEVVALVGGGKLHDGMKVIPVKNR